MTDKVKIVVTGGSGFIGTNIVEFYLKKGIEVLSLDCVEPKIDKHRPCWKKIDVLDLAGLTASIQEFDPTHVIHLAARTDLDEKKDITGYRANTDGVKNLIQALRDCKNLKRVMFTSSMYVCFPGYDPKNYDDYSPHTLYGQSKVLTEKIVKENSSLAFDWLIIRPTSIWGPWFGHPYKDFFYHVRRRTYFKMRGKTATKTYGYILNSIHQIDFLLFAERSMINKHTFYIGDHPGLNINSWADQIASQLNIRIYFVPRFVLFLGAMFGDILSVFGVRFPLQSFRIKNMTTDNVIGLLDDTIKVIPEMPYTVEQGIAMTLEWLKSNDPDF